MLVAIYIFFFLDLRYIEGLVSTVAIDDTLVNQKKVLQNSILVLGAGIVYEKGSIGYLKNNIFEFIFSYPNKILFSGH